MKRGHVAWCVRSRASRLAAAAAGALAGALLMVTAGSAATSGGSPGLRMPRSHAPGYYDYTVAPGAVVNDHIIVVNTTSTTQLFELYPVDGYTSNLTGVVYADRAAPRQQVSTWITVRTTSVRLAPGATATVAFSVTVPDPLGIGDYVGGIAAENPATSQSAGSNLALNVVQRTVMAVVVHIAGPAVRGFSLGQPSVRVENGRRQVLDIPISSTSNVFIKPLLAGRLQTCAGRELLRMDRQLDTFVPDSSIIYPYYLDTVLLQEGCYQTVLDVSAGGEQLGHFTSTITISKAQATLPRRPQAAQSGVTPQASSVPGWVIPVVGAALLLLLLNFLLLFLLLWRRRRRTEEEREALRAGGETRLSR